MTLSNAKATADVEYGHGERTLVVSAESSADIAGFEGEVGSQGDDGYLLRGPLSEKNAAELRNLFTHLRPQPLGHARSVGTGDRLGLATPGHARAFQRVGGAVAPVFAQQSIREMERLGRSAQQVLDDATFGCVEAGWTGPVGADLDHIKTIEGIERGLAAGFTTFTLDPGDHVVDPDTVSGDISDAVPWAALEDTPADFRRRYVGTTVQVGDDAVELTESNMLRSAVKYGKAIAHAVEMARFVVERASYPVEIEIAIDETDFVTEVIEHYYMAAELQRLGVQWVSLAPRYVDGFEKGVEFLGSIPDLAANLRQHLAVAEQFGGYKISLHSGSDKFSIYPIAVVATEGRVHLKTSGTSYLCALEVAAVREPDLFREIYAISREAYRQARASYQVSAQIDRTPEPDQVTDADLPGLVEQFDSRQILHVGYGDVLTLTDATGERPIDAAVRAMLITHASQYADIVDQHIGRHLTAFA